MYDAALFYQEKANTQSNVLERLKLKPKSFALATCHRAENTDDAFKLGQILAALAEIAKNCKVVLPLHPRTKKIIDDLLYKNNIKINIDFDLSKSTTQWIREASLVVCSYSSIALESLLAGVPSVRVLNLDQPPMVDEEEGVRCVATQHEFLDVVRKLDATLEKCSISSNAANTLEKFFYKFDGQASKRFWVELNRLNDLPIKRVLGL
jgi:UDP-N-acetylglucosamine 2-epimerase